MKRIQQTILAFFLFSAIISFTACNDDEGPTTGGGETEEKVFNKELLYDKIWEDETGTIQHKFDSDGTYNNIGTWNWVNNSDTMSFTLAGTTFTFVFNVGNTATQMEARQPTSAAWGLYKTQW
jgi:hypothetical protein